MGFEVEVEVRDGGRVTVKERLGTCLRVLELEAHPRVPVASEVGES